MKNTKMNFQKELRSASVIFIFMLLSSFSWAQLNNMKFTKGTRGQSSFEFERATSANSSFIGGFKFYSENFENNNFKNKGTRMAFEYRKYLNGGTKTMNGIYLAPNISLGRHTVSYEDIPNSKIGWSLFSVGLSLATQNANLLYFPEQEETVTGESKVISSGMITFDIGMNISKNSIRDSKGMRVSDGTIKEYNPDIQGTDVNLYFGMGYAF